jgi:hypothetical protein
MRRRPRAEKPVPEPAPDAPFRAAPAPDPRTRGTPVKLAQACGFHNDPPRAEDCPGRANYDASDWKSSGKRLHMTQTVILMP